MLLCAASPKQGPEVSSPLPTSQDSESFSVDGSGDGSSHGAGGRARPGFGAASRPRQGLGQNEAGTGPDAQKITAIPS